METWSGTVGKTLRNIPKGFSLRIQGLVGPTGMPIGTQSITNFGFAQGALLTLNSQRENAEHIWGSAAMIAPGIAITAAHVLEEYEKQGHLSNDVSLFAIGPAAEDGLMIWQVFEITFVAGSDLAIIKMELCSDFSSGYTLNVLESTARSPEVGEMVSVVGYRASAARFEKENEAPGLELFVSVGKVIERFENGRDKFLPAPCFAAEISTVGGMSGGPVFNAAGKFVGVLSSGMDDLSYVSLLRYALVTEISSRWPLNWYSSRPLLKDAMGAFVEDGHRLRIIRDSVTGERKLEYHHTP